MKINWKVRFSKNNIQFIVRFIAALLIPVLAYMGLNYEDFSTWNMVGEFFFNFISNPFLVFLTVVNAINIVPDPTTAGLGDSRQAMRYLTPKNDRDYI